MKAEKVLIAIDTEKESIIRKQIGAVQRAYVSYVAELSSQGLAYSNNVSESLTWAANSVKIESERAISEKAKLSLIGINPAQAVDNWNAVHRLLIELGIGWDGLDKDGRVLTHIIDGLVEGCNIYAESVKEVELTHTLKALISASEGLYELMERDGKNKPNLNQISGAFLGLIVHNGNGALGINPSALKMYAR